MAEYKHINPQATGVFLKKTLLDLMPEAGSFETGIPGLRITRQNEPTQSANCFYIPRILDLNTDGTLTQTPFFPKEGDDVSLQVYQSPDSRESTRIRYHADTRELTLEKGLSSLSRETA